MKEIKQVNQAAKLQVEIWSDIMCPFCYIGKRRFEEALEQFPAKDKIEVVWKSFQLDPEMQSQPGKNIYDYLAERKGQTREWSVKMHEQVVQMAKDAGLTYNFDKAVIANSFDAHRLIQLAKTKGLGDAAEEALFKAYFTEGKDMGNHATLLALGEQIGLDKEQLQQVLNSDAYTDEVKRDIYESQQVGARGVPFFVMDRRYAVSGAQPVQAFTQTLEATYNEWLKENPEGAICTPDGCN